MPCFGSDIILNNPAFIHDTAHIYGKVRLEEGSSVWANAVIRAETHEVVVGEKSNIQDFVMIHIGWNTGVYIGKHTSITHHCTLHGCTIGNNCLIGINSTIMDACVIGNNCIVGGHTFLKEGTVIPDNSVVMGVPGTVVKTKNSSEANLMNAIVYYKNGIAYSSGNYRLWKGSEFVGEIAKELEAVKKQVDI